MDIIGRKEECRILKTCYASGKPELIVLYGRRRVGKTYLVKKLFGDSFTFYMTGLYRRQKQVQLANFAYSLSQFSGIDEAVPADWMQAFKRLKEYIVSLDPAERKVIFIDEIPWLDTQKSDLMAALDLFWNGWGNNRNDLMIILCGSATSWITDKLLGDKGGMFNRDTFRIYLSPFTLGETEEFLAAKEIRPTRYEIVEYYMIMGGIPYYLDKIQRGKSVAQNVDALFFKRRGLLWDEFRHLYDTLWGNNENYAKIARFLSGRISGYTRDEISKGVGLASGGDLTRFLNDLRDCDFIRESIQYGKESNGKIYQLTDFYSLFYFRFIENASDENFWEHNIDNPQRRVWTGYAFEQVCLWHCNQIKQALGIGGISSTCSSFRSSGENVNAQIDLLIDRRDNVVNVCEIKYSRSPFIIDADYAEELSRKLSVLGNKLNRRKSLQLTMITPFGTANGKYSSMVDQDLAADVLFG